MIQLNDNLKKIKNTNKKSAFGAAYVQRLCMVDYINAKKIIEKGVNVGLLVKVSKVKYRIRPTCIIFNDLKEVD